MYNAAEKNQYLYTCTLYIYKFDFFKVITYPKPYWVGIKSSKDLSVL